MILTPLHPINIFQRAAMNHLILFMTERMSLKKWVDKGLFNREIAIYKALAQDIKVTIVSYGTENEAHFLKGIKNICVISNTDKLNDEDYIHSLAARIDDSPKYTVVKCNQIKGGHLAAKFAELNNLPFIARAGYLQSDFVRNKFSFNLIAKRMRLKKTLAHENQVFNSASLIVVSTPLIKSQIIAAHGISAEKIHVVPNYVDTSIFQPSQLPRIENRVIYIGRLESQKNLFTLIKACANIPNIELILVGEGSLRNRLETLAKKLKLNVNFLGQVPNNTLPSLINTSSVFVLPSYFEGHPKSLIEAMATGIPILGTDVSGTRETIQHGENGMLCATQAKEMTSALIELLSNKLLGKKLGENGAIFAEKNYSLNRIVQMELENIQKAQLEYSTLNLKKIH